MEKLKIDNLNLMYGSFQALKNVNLSIPSNEITAFIGPSGCGKSTLLKSLNRMNDLVEGCRITGGVYLDGEDIYRGMDVSLLRKRVGMVFQKPNPFPMSIYDNVVSARGRTASAHGTVWMKWSNLHSAPRRSGTRSRTVSKQAPCSFRAGSSSGSALRGLWPFSPRFS